MRNHATQKQSKYFILFVARERAGIIGRRGIIGPPDLVIEILSASTAAYDRGAKLHGYEQAGVRELWLIDPYGPAGCEFYRLDGQRYTPVAPDAQGWLRSAAAPGFAIDVRWLWPQGRFITVRQALAALEAQGSQANVE